MHATQRLTWFRRFDLHLLDHLERAHARYVPPSEQYHKYVERACAECEAHVNYALAMETRHELGVDQSWKNMSTLEPFPIDLYWVQKETNIVHGLTIVGVFRNNFFSTKVLFGGGMAIDLTYLRWDSIGSRILHDTWGMQRGVLEGLLEKYFWMRSFFSLEGRQDVCIIRHPNAALTEEGKEWQMRVSFAELKNCSIGREMLEYCSTV